MPSANAGFEWEFSCETLKTFNTDEQSEAALKESFIFLFPISPHLGLLDYPTNMN